MGKCLKTVVQGSHQAAVDYLGSALLKNNMWEDILYNHYIYNSCSLVLNLNQLRGMYMFSALREITSSVYIWSIIASIGCKIAIACGLPIEVLLIPRT